MNQKNQGVQEQQKAGKKKVMVKLAKADKMQLANYLGPMRTEIKRQLVELLVEVEKKKTGNKSRMANDAAAELTAPAAG